MLRQWRAWWDSGGLGWRGWSAMSWEPGWAFLDGSVLDVPGLSKIQDLSGWLRSKEVGMIQQYRNGDCQGRSVLNGLTRLPLGQMASLSPEQR